MKKIYKITILILLIYLFRCGLGPSLGVPDYKIAYIPNDQIPAIYVMNADGTNKSIIHQEINENTRFRYLFWNTSNDIFFVANRYSSSENGLIQKDILYQINRKTGSSQTIFGSHTYIYDLIHNQNMLCAFFEVGRSQLNILNLETKNVQIINLTSLKKYKTLCWSADPNIILLYTYENMNLKIYRLDLSNSYVYYFTTIENTSPDPIPSPNGQKIAYLKSDRTSISVFDINELNSKIINSSINPTGPIVWSTDNINLIHSDYIYEEGKYSINTYLVNSENKSILKILTENSHYYLGKFFPDGIRLSFNIETNSHGQYDLMVSNISNYTVVNLTSDQYTYSGHRGDILHAISYNIIY